MMKVSDFIRMFQGQIMVRVRTGNTLDENGNLDFIIDVHPLAVNMAGQIQIDPKRITSLVWKVPFVPGTRLSMDDLYMEIKNANVTKTGLILPPGVCADQESGEVRADIPVQSETEAFRLPEGAGDNTISSDVGAAADTWSVTGDSISSIEDGNGG